MKKYGILIAVVAIILVIVLCLCLRCPGVSKEEVVGTWQAEYVYKGNPVSATLILTSEDTYQFKTILNGEIYSDDTGIYVIDGCDVILHVDGNFEISSIFEYKKGVLTHNSNKFFKE